MGRRAPLDGRKRFASEVVEGLLVFGHTRDTTRE